MLIEKLFYIKMNIEDTDLAEDEIEYIQSELDFAEYEIKEMIQQRIEMKDHDSVVDVEVYDSWIQDGQLTYRVYSMPE